ncbi:MAG: ABC transporter ATP-binding protein [Caldilineaceae bacterium]
MQAQILNLLQDLQREFNLAMIFVAHDLSVVEHVSDRVAVMYVGRSSRPPDRGTLSQAAAPYTEALLSAVSEPDPDRHKTRLILPGEVANPAAPPSGCYFHLRCCYAEAKCRRRAGVARGHRRSHFARCHFAGQLDLKGVAA